MNWVSRQAVPPPLYLVPKPSVQPTLSRAFVEHFVEPCGFWPFSTKWVDKVHDKGPRTPFMGQALTKLGSWRGPNQRPADRQVARQRHELPDLPPQSREILVHIAAQTVCNLAGKFWMTVRQFAKTEVRVVKRVHQFAHVLNAFPKFGRVILEAFRRKIARAQRFMNGVAGHHAALEGEHHAG